MAKIAARLTELIVNTPLLELTNYEKELGLKAHIVAKLEYFNPWGSVKDRAAPALCRKQILIVQAHNLRIALSVITYC